MSSEAEILALLTALQPLKNSKEFLGNGSLQKLQGYVMVLEPYRTDDLKAAIRSCLATDEWFPAPARLRELCELELDRLAERAVQIAMATKIDPKGLEAFEGRALFYEQIRRWEEAVGVDREEWNRCDTNRKKARLLKAWEQIEPRRTTERLGPLLDSMFDERKLPRIGEEKPQLPRNGSGSE